LLPVEVAVLEIDKAARVAVAAVLEDCWPALILL